jgi:SAM-dependent methyltransferase
MAKSQQWYGTFFDDARSIFSIVSTKETNEQVRFAVKLLGLRKGKSFLDCPCGIGRISIPLAQRGIRVTGVDLTKSYLDELQAEARKRKLKIPTLHADMRKIPYKNQFDAAGNLWTSFGFFEDERQNLLAIKKAYDALKPGGKFLLHVINRDWILTYFTPTDWSELPGVILFEKRQFDYAKSVIRGVWRFFRDGKITEHHVDIRMYSYHEILGMFDKVGFVDIQGFGTIKGGPIDRHSRMMWVVGTKPKSVKRRKA